MTDWLNRGGLIRLRRAAWPALLAIGFLVACCLYAAGCGASAITTHARAALITTSVVRVADEVATEARSAALDRVEAEHPTDPEHDDAVRAESARWRPLGLALDAVREALLSWVQAIDLARIAGDDTLGIAELLPAAQRVLALYARVAALAVDLGADLPSLPSWVTALLPAGGAS